MKLSFYKYQGTGNDFIVVDNRQGLLSKNNTILIKRLCDRKFGIGADGFILLEKPQHPAEDFVMLYFNADGRESSMCGNGGRCIVAFAKFLGVIGSRTTFTAVDGLHEAIVQQEIVSLKMKDVPDFQEQEEHVFLETGSPHHVVFSAGVNQLNVRELGAQIRNAPVYAEGGGTNVNFAEQLGANQFRVRTFERGVEDETLSCGTGVTAVALAAYIKGKTENETINLETSGGTLEVSFEATGRSFKNIWLSGAATQVFKGEIAC